MSYVTWRRLQYALHDLSQGKKVIDVAMEYGFEISICFDINESTGEFSYYAKKCVNLN